MSLAERAVKEIDAIPSWQFWRHWEREFWYGAILAAYARDTGSGAADGAATKIIDKYGERYLRKYGVEI
jgi:hypothetical protein